MDARRENKEMFLGESDTGLVIGKKSRGVPGYIPQRYDVIRCDFIYFGMRERVLHCVFRDVWKGDGKWEKERRYSRHGSTGVGL